MTDETLRTYDPALRAERARRLQDAALRASSALGDDWGFELMVSGSLSRGQVHPWSDLDLVLRPSGYLEVDDLDPRFRRIKREVDGLIRQAVGDIATDIVFEDEIVDGLRKGMLGSLVHPSAIPGLSALPCPSITIARLHVSIRYALMASAAIEDSYRRLEDGMAGSMRFFNRMVSLQALDPLRSKSELWVKKLAVFADFGRSHWLDDRADMDALHALLERLCLPGTSPDGISPILDKKAAAALEYLASDPFDLMLRSEARNSTSASKGVRASIEALGRRLEAMVPGVETHGLEEGTSFSP